MGSGSELLKVISFNQPFLGRLRHHVMIPEVFEVYNILGHIFQLYIYICIYIYVYSSYYHSTGPTESLPSSGPNDLTHTQGFGASKVFLLRSCLYCKLEHLELWWNLLVFEIVGPFLYGKPSHFPWADHVFPTKSPALFGKYPLLLIACIVDHSPFVKVKSRCYPMLFNYGKSVFY